MATSTHLNTDVDESPQTLAQLAGGGLPIINIRDWIGPRGLIAQIGNPISGSLITSPVLTPGLPIQR